jgi:hypothetical protein
MHAIRARVQRLVNVPIAWIPSASSPRETRQR